MAFSPRAQCGCLILHGYGGTPLELGHIARTLAAQGVAVRLPTLPGHGTEHGSRSAGFAALRFADWLSFVEEELAALRAQCDRVVVVGFSMGGTLALNLASRFPVAGVATISAPLYVLHVSPWPWAHAVFYASSAWAQLVKVARLFRKAPGDTATPNATRAKGYDGPLNLAQLYSFRQGCIATRKLLPNLTAPLLVMHDTNDRIVYSGNACEIARRVSSPSATVRFTRMKDTTTRRHMIVTHRETEDFVTRTVTEFCLSCCA